MEKDTFYGDGVKNQFTIGDKNGDNSDGNSHFEFIICGCICLGKENPTVHVAN